MIGYYETLLTETLDRHVMDPAATAVQLSGGLDSANVAMSLAYAHPGQITTGAMILDAESAIQQLRRRSTMIHHARFPTDVQIVAMKHLPFTSGGPRFDAGPGLLTPYDEPYYEASAALANALAAKGIRHVVTGIGGDEMVALTATERPHPPLGQGREFQPWIGPNTVSYSMTQNKGSPHHRRLTK